MNDKLNIDFSKLTDTLPPEYKFIFTIYIAFIMVGIGSAIYGIVRNENMALYLSFLCFVVVLVAAIVVIKIVNDNKIKQLERKLKEIPLLDLYCSFQFPEEDDIRVKFMNEVNGTYTLSNNNDEFKGDVKLSFEDKGGYFWKPPQQIEHGQQIYLTLKEDTGEKWVAQSIIELPSRTRVNSRPISLRRVD